MLVIAEMEKLSLSFGPVSYQPPTGGGGFSSASVTLDKHNVVGKRGPYLHSFYSASLH